MSKKIDKKILYVSDLDGTLLQSDEKISNYTNQTINNLVEEGMIFSYATARSYHTSIKVTKGLNAQIPLIVYNGAFVVDNVTGEILLSNFFNDDVNDVLDTLIRNDIVPIVYSVIDDVEKFSFIKERCTQAMLDFIQTRKNDSRYHPVYRIEDLYKGNKFYLTCIGDKEKLEPFYHQYKNRYHCVFQQDIYTNEQWLEIMPLEASKSHAIRQLKEYLGCHYVVSFGDGKNDIDMFELSNECYAVENAVDELKAKATGVIGHHDQDGVARWLIENVKKS